MNSRLLKVIISIAASLCSAAISFFSAFIVLWRFMDKTLTPDIRIAEYLNNILNLTIKDAVIRSLYSGLICGITVFLMFWYINLIIYVIKTSESKNSVPLRILWIALITMPVLAAVLFCCVTICFI